MRNIAQDVKVYPLVGPAQIAGQTITTTGAYVAVTPNEEQDAVAVVNFGFVPGGSPSVSYQVTILGATSAAGAGAVTLATISSPSYPNTGSFVLGPQVASAQVIIPGAQYQYVAAKVILNVGSTTQVAATPSLSYGVTLLQRQTVGSTNNLSATT